MVAPTLESYIFGAAAEKFVTEKRPELAEHIMKQQYYNDPANPVLARAFVDFHDAYKSGSNPLATSVGRRISTEQALYDNMLRGMTLKDIADSCLGTGIAPAVRAELITKDGAINYGEVRKSIFDYNDELEGAKRKLDRKQDELNRDYEVAMNGAYTDEQRRDVEDNFGEKMRKLQKEMHKKLKELETKYSLKEAQRRLGVVQAMEEAQFAVIGRNATLNNAYFPVKIEDLRKVAQN